MSLEIHAVSTTVSCQVSSGEGHLSAEIDSREWGYNGGRSQFFAGDNCYALVYKSSNVNIIGSACSGVGTTFTRFGTDNGFNVQREGITFSTPVAKSRLPLPAKVTLLESNYTNCNGPEYIIGDIIIRLKTWTNTGDITKPPPYGFIFIEYEPLADVWKFGGLVAIDGLLSTPVHGSIFGVVSAPATVSFIGL